MRLPDEIYIVQHEQAHSMAFLDLIDAYAYVNTLKTSNNVRLFYEMQEELTRTGSATLFPGLTITKHPLSKPRTLISCGTA